MNPGKARILTCPHCGSEKEVMSLLSGNTFGGTQWSDTKQILPMLPSVFPIQKCLSCGHYYLLSRQEDQKHSNSVSFETGDLTFAEMKEAVAESSGWGITHEEEYVIRLYAVYAYNDEYYRTQNLSHMRQPSNEDEAFFKENAVKLIEVGANEILKAELHREMGNFEECIEVLEKYETDDEFIDEIVRTMRSKAESEDKTIWQIY